MAAVKVIQGFTAGLFDTPCGRWGLEAIESLELLMNKIEVAQFVTCEFFPASLCRETLRSFTRFASS